ncbi:hypothetical protein [Acanthopleuribacter pedis]|uniref:Uncharacterized protein n=1 Tax=Acanthopleuribacter pedis TaxID=442870 RepID=A0A8J7Q4X5_9BACT|nr:hypothetical protein [Acanthopleuribacter pedis]MBO1317926.1 hypothetical protein [Acanthopleuribacter pedis]
MIESVGGGVNLSAQYAQLKSQSQPQSAPLESSGGGLPPTASAFDIALQIQDIQVTNLERTLDAQRSIIDLLV